MENGIEVIGIDHGWAQMKTVSEVFTSGVEEIVNEPAFFDDVLEYQGKYYKIGGERLKVKRTKVEDENYYLLTLAALAKELDNRGKREANVVLAVGLPLTRFSDERDKFISYLSKNEKITFSYEERIYQIKVSKVSVYPQCYSAVANQISSFGKKVLVVDVGSWTIDSMPIINKKPDDTKCDTQNHGLITCMNDIKKKCIRQLNSTLDEMAIQEYMMIGKTDLNEHFKAIMDACIQSFVEKVYHSLRESGYNLETMTIIFVGGGACVMKNFGKHQTSNISYVLDVKANAKGFETLAKIAMRSGR